VNLFVFQELSDEEAKNAGHESDQEDFMAMLDDLIGDKPQDPKSGKSFLESIRRSKTSTSDDISAKKIDVDHINLPSPTVRPREVTRSPSPPPAEVAVIDSSSSSLSASPSPEKENSRKRKNAIVGICFACGHTEGTDINNLFKHIRSHPPEKKGNCPDCSRPLNCPDNAIRHMINEHVPATSRQALLDYWKPEVRAKMKKLASNDIPGKFLFKAL